MLFFM